MDSLLRTIKKLIPRKLFRAVQPYYHSYITSLGALRYGYPSKELYVIGVTGTKGKSTTTEVLSAILEEAGHTVAVSNTIHIKIADDDRPNLYKMSMPGRFFLQHFLRTAVKEDCGFAILEMTSEGAKVNRHKHIELDALIFTNLSPEHIESHGSYEAYRDAKLKYRDALITSQKKEKLIIVNKDDPSSKHFLEVPSSITSYSFSLKQAEPYVSNERGTLFTYKGTSIHSPLPGVFNLYNILGAITFARTLGISMEVIKRAIEKLTLVKGRVQRIEEGQKFGVIVDYAHTTDSLEKLYASFPDSGKICVLGNCGGGRDTWKRPEMAKMAEKYCKEIVLTNEDPYDEDPLKILADMERAFSVKKPEVIMDRRLAIRHALSRAGQNDVVLITGKGTDPYIMGPRGTKTPWSDELVVREELRKLFGTPKEHDTGSDGHIK